MNKKIENEIVQLEELDEYIKFIKSLDLSSVYDISEILREYPSRKARYIFALEQQNSKVVEMEQKLKIIYYELYKEYKLEKKGNNLTEEGVKAMIYTDERYQKQLEKLLEEKRKLGILKGAKEALDDLGRMLYAIIGIKD